LTLKERGEVDELQTIENAKTSCQDSFSKELGPQDCRQAHYAWVAAIQTHLTLLEVPAGIEVWGLQGFVLT